MFPTFLGFTNLVVVFDDGVIFVLETRVPFDDLLFDVAVRRIVTLVAILYLSMFTLPENSSLFVDSISYSTSQSYSFRNSIILSVE